MDSAIDNAQCPFQHHFHPELVNKERSSINPLVLSYAQRIYMVDEKGVELDEVASYNFWW